MPIWHLLKDEDGIQIGPCNVPEDAQVSLQHLSEYDYSERCSRDNILAEVQKINDEKEREEAQRLRLLLEEERHHVERADAMQPYVEKANSAMDALKFALSSSITDYLMLIHNETGLEEFIIGGSWAASMIADVQSTIFHDDDGVDIMCLDANDVDVFHGDFTMDKNKNLHVKLDKISKKNRAGFFLGNKCCRMWKPECPYFSQKQ